MPCVEAHRVRRPNALPSVAPCMQITDAALAARFADDVRVLG